ncbi:TAXI family TRAP transporter solute-binding subunit [Aquibium microcysteis]|uniref:TAXI family TRAP transporter solute-binding subunit n=1 Tax=Aquibium microcysteis TaxID=675281 RepID=UPI00165D055E|nr:TAXI family TRAP transporter solute-binding subunit [Aquibium microcysteis]
MFIRFAATLILSATAMICGARAEPVTIASAAQGSSTYNIALAVARAAGEIGGLDLRPQPYKSTSQGAAFVDGGEVDFGLENAFAVREAMLGLGRFEGQKMSNLRLVARLQPLRMALAVRKDSGIRSFDDLRGKRLPAGFRAAVTGELLISAMLANGGLSYDDVEKVPVNDFTAMADAFAAGQLDAYIFVIGTPRDEQVSRTVGGLVPMPFDDGAEALAKLKDVLPVASLGRLQPDPSLVDIDKETVVLEYDYFVYTHAGEADDTVRRMVESLHGGKNLMVQSVASMAWFDPARINADIGLPYHPAAEAFFREKGLSN